MSNECLGKVLKFHGSIANGVWYRPEKLQRPPPVIRLIRLRGSWACRARSHRASKLWPTQSVTWMVYQMNSQWVSILKCVEERRIDNRIREAIPVIDSYRKEVLSCAAWCLGLGQFQRASSCDATGAQLESAQSADVYSTMQHDVDVNHVTAPSICVVMNDTWKLITLIKRIFSPYRSSVGRALDSR